jgi:hypothetical protein
MPKSDKKKAAKLKARADRMNARVVKFDALRDSLDAVKVEGTTDATRWFRTAPIIGAVPVSTGFIDEENGILHDVAVATLGEARGHNVQLDRAFLNQLVELGNAAKKGLKSRFGHPNASGTSLGTFVGRAVDFRIRPDSPNVVRADIHLDAKVAKDSPNGNLYDYILRMAAHNPDMFGTSIVFKPGIEIDPSEIPDGDRLFADLPVATIDEFLAVDIVDDPAANPDGLFSAWSKEQIAGQVTAFLDANPQIWEVLDDHPEAVAPFFERYRSYLSAKTKNEGEAMPKPEAKKLEAEDASAEETVAVAVAEDAVAEVATEENQEAAPVAEVTEAAAEETEAPVAETVAASAGNDRVAELKQIDEAFGAEIAAVALRENLSFADASVRAVAALRAENESLRNAPAPVRHEDGGAAPLSGGEGTTKAKPRKQFATNLSDAAAARAEYLENRMNRGK